MRGGAACGAGEAVDVPAQLERAAHGAQQLAQGVHDGVALMGADLQQQIAVALSRIKVVDRERGHLDQLAWALRGESVAFVEQRCSEGDRHGQHVGIVDRPEDSRVSRWVVDLEQRGGGTVGQFARAQAQRPEGFLERLPVGCERIECRERRLRRCGREDACLMGAVEGLTLGELCLGDVPFLCCCGLGGDRRRLFGLCGGAHDRAGSADTAGSQQHSRAS